MSEKSPTQGAMDLAEIGADLEEQVASSVTLLSHRQLVVLRFRKNRLAVAGMVVLSILYLMAGFCEFVAPYEPHHRFRGGAYLPPVRVHLRDEEGRWHAPFIYARKSQTNRETFEREYVEDTTTRYPIKLFVRGDEYKWWGLFKTNVHLFGVDEEGAPLALLGTDKLGRDLLTRIIYGARLSLSVGLVGVFMSFFIGLTLGGAAGLLGGTVDNIIMRVNDFVRSIPSVPLWMGLAAAVPPEWPQTRVYFAITVILSFVGWTGLSRIVRGRFLALREDDFVLAAIQAGAGPWYLIWEHLVPSFMSYVLVQLTLDIPGMILGETSLSFLGLGLLPPAVSWGVLLRDAQQLQEVALHPWILSPVAFVFATVLSLNFFGDGLRDAADPYSERM
jgi:peptide/nickel transport system permease protein